ncbi:T9SS type A sorting domain-containing protein [Segetibacter sp. 3557_3]|uniref:T9SS type A sorting domain-containing protein n=1 Tax=Segetibacter sp. 3557_3 TaxID=2547429 RepID=UPI0010585FC6|nr:T9SS type A sorting domain-containing protein [Segetibacter sp. 3557_3]TDH21395.1 T9SS type A sorting domain-containing protein [Segetibacter sp. 3557_3]
MKKTILPISAFAAAFLSLTASAQSNKTFAVTSESKGTYNWTVVREIDLATGEVIKDLYNSTVNKNVTVKSESSDVAQLRLDQTSPMSQGVAAAAFDAKHNRLYFTTMRGTDLRYFDLNEAGTTISVNANKNFNTGNKFDEANVITRMAFTADGLGYAITNDGKHVIRFTTDQKPTVTDLGQLTDGKDNGTISVHNQCSSWGGDMVGDAYGNLYMVTYRNYLFKINPQTLIADLVGQIKGLPAQFTSNGAAVDANGELFISSAMMADNYFKVNISTLDATPLHKKEDKVYNASDLANSNLLYQNKSVTDTKSRPELRGNSAVSIYPNPVVSKSFTVQFDKVPAGQYNLALTDASGRNVMTRLVKISLFGQVERISLPRASGGGVYMLKLTGGDRQVVYNDKIVVQ